ncbi:hypothetical protein CBR_g29605 [Chara braunii]|uniref:Fucosyltransferase n=1 Tax=Chara braunii TaxID=69332 RepID=A0A388LAW9_CHABU|nr:hypothetical protein CBR_g29605 [Chara braunii]|eukprot:GBG79459.1 hypothetical protein CBR_g29605 [Chara braunii]
MKSFHSKACLAKGMLAITSMGLLAMLLVSAIYMKDSPSINSDPGPTNIAAEENSYSCRSWRTSVSHCPSPAFESFYKTYTARASAVLRSGNFSNAQFLVHVSGPWGVGNRLTSLVSAFLIGFLTDRIVLTNYPDFYHFYDPEGLPDIHLNTYAQRLEADPRFAAEDSNLTLQCTDELPELLASGNLSRVWESKHNIMFWCQDYSLPYLLVNPVYSNILSNFFPSFEPFHDIATKVLRPSMRMQEVVNSFVKMNFIKHKQMIGVHARFLKHIPRHKVPLSAVYSSFAESLQLRLHLPDRDVGFFIATDSNHEREEIMRQIKGSTAMITAKYVYYLRSNKLEEYHTFDNPGTEESAHTDLFLLASCQHLVVTFSSSFGQVAAGLGGIPAYSVIGAPEDGWGSHVAWVAAGASSEPCPYLMKRMMEVKWDEPWAHRFRTLPSWVHYSQCHHYC